MTETKPPEPTGLRRLACRIFAALDREPVALAFATTLLLVCFFYRTTLALTLYHDAATPFGFSPAATPLWAFLKTIGDDLLVVFALGSVYLAAKTWLRWRAPRFTGSLPVRTIEIVLAAAILITLATIMRAHHHMIIELENGLNVTMLMTASTLLAPKDVANLFKPGDVAFVLFPILAFVATLCASRWLKRVYKPVLLGLCSIALLLNLLALGKSLAPELKHNPAAYLLADALKAPYRAYFTSNPYRDRTDLPGDAQLRSIRLIDEAFVTSPEIPPPPPTPEGRPWNIVLCVLESAGSDYVFDTSRTNEVPMPFLQQMSREGLYLTNHHATANSSPSALFSILSGLYPPPTAEQYAQTESASIPLINRFVGTNYDTFMVHASSLTYSFPQHLFLNSGLTELNNQHVIPAGNTKDLTELARDEPKAVTFLLERLDRAREPFFAIYWSFIPHHPYSDYGPDSHVFSPRDKRGRYINNLRVLDVQLRRIHEHLARSGKLERTLVVFVGDHGEAFGQHPGVWTHSVGSYSEMFRAPVIFWQPKLVAAREVTFPTSHVDIVPTMLDLIGAAWDPARFQGESLLRGEPSRKYIFSMDGLADYLSVIDKQMNKVTLSFEHGVPLIFNLAKDPGEKVPLHEARFQEHIDALLKYRNYQTKLIKEYQDAVINHREFPPP